MVKSTWPGVSMMLIRCSRQKQVVAAAVMVMPRSCSCLHPVHGRGPFVDLANLVRDTRVIEDALGGRGLPRINVRHDPDVPGLRYGELTTHDCECLSDAQAIYPPAKCRVRDRQVRRTVLK